MGKLALSIMLGFAATTVNAACTVTTGGLPLELPNPGDAGSDPFACVRRNFQSLSTNTALSGSFSSATFHRVYTDTITALGSEVVFSSHVYMAETLQVVGQITGDVTGDLTGKADTAGNADTVTTNADLTGDVTSSGNATTLATLSGSLTKVSAGAITSDGTDVTITADMIVTDLLGVGGVACSTCGLHVQKDAAIAGKLRVDGDFIAGGANTFIRGGLTFTSSFTATRMKLAPGNNNLDIDGTNIIIEVSNTAGTSVSYIEFNNAGTGSGSRFGLGGGARTQFGSGGIYRFFLKPGSSSDVSNEFMVLNIEVGGEIGLGNSLFKSTFSATGQLAVPTSISVGDGALTAGPFQALPPTAQTISAGNTITADACGTLKKITAAGSVTTDTTNTFTAPATANEGCCMDVANVGGNDITLDNNALFASAGGADVVLGANDTVRVCSSGAAWFQIGATGNN